LIGTWGTGNYIKAYNSADAANTSVGANLGYLDTQVKVNADDITDIQDDMLVGFGGNYIAAGTDVAANLEALDAQAKVNADAIAGKTLTVDTSTGVATIKDGTTTAEVYTKDAAETIFAEKQAWTSKEFGYDTASTDAKTILTAAGFTNQTTGDTDVGLIDAALQLKADKQDKLDIQANSGLKWNDANQTQLAIKLADTSTTKSGLQLDDNGLSIKVGDTMQITNEGYLNIKYDTNTFTTDSTSGLKIKDKGITTAMLDDGAVTFNKLASSVYSTTVGSGSDTVLATTSAVKSC